MASRRDLKENFEDMREESPYKCRACVTAHFPMDIVLSAARIVFVENSN
jgi:hypothetical protein